MAYFCRVLSWPSPFPHITFQVWFGLFFFLHCSFLSTHFLTEPRMSFYQKFSSLIVELRLFWPHNTFFFFFFTEEFQLFPALLLFLMDNSVYSFAHLGNQHRFITACDSLLHVHIPFEQDNIPSVTQAMMSCMYHLEV